jgi:hypothetical protein
MSDDRDYQYGEPFWRDPREQIAGLQTRCASIGGIQDADPRAAYNSAVSDEEKKAKEQRK